MMLATSEARWENEGGAPEGDESSDLTRADFPGDDVGARNNLARWLNLEPRLDSRAVAQAVSRWQPYAGMVCFHLLLDRLAAMGQLDGPRGSEGLETST